ncbi:MAG: hypothetical protein MJ099_03335, partial [Clostridia bacterium]|nr:hypothetical protein [Clostridia bacterium]
MNSLFGIGIVGVMALVFILAVVTGKHNRKRTSASTLVAVGLIVGTMLGGSTTIGTAQLAYNYGFSAWWYTVGLGISCILLTIGFDAPMRKHKGMTVNGMIGDAYGKKAEICSSYLTSVGMFINVISQLVSATAVLAVVFPTMGKWIALLIAAVFVFVYSASGGAKGAGFVGIFKTIMLMGTMIACGIVVLKVMGGIGGFTATIREVEKTEGIPLLTMFARGAAIDIGAGLSVVFGVISTQTYARAIMLTRSDLSAKTTTMLSALLTGP